MSAPSGSTHGARGTGAPVPTRQVALIIWTALLVGVAIFASVGTYVGPRSFWGTRDELVEILAPIAIGMAVLGLVASRIIPARVKQAPAATPDALGVARTIIASALNEGPALFGVITWMLTGTPLALAALAISVAGMLAAFPSAARWPRLCGVVGQGAANPLVR